MTLLRSLVFLVWLYGTMTAVGIVWLPAALSSRAGAVSAGRAWTRLALWGARWIVGIRVEVRGRERLPPGPVLVAAKHQAMIDTLLPFVLFDQPAVVLKKELLGMPIFGWYARQMEMIPVDREANMAALKAMLAAARTARGDGRVLVIFPEGTRQPIGAPPDYKPGVAALYRDLGLPCVPVALNSGLVWEGRGILRRPGTIVWEFLEPIPPGLKRDAFMQAMEERIEAGSDALLPPALRAPRAREGVGPS
jgi:1-acyl-sn-glycerol-3-phosphate acyltransferase